MDKQSFLFLCSGTSRRFTIPDLALKPLIRADQQRWLSLCRISSTG
uniref:Uncharacterized protein n=1 Tax=Lotus japonicus TaxID=34305 RepID=I3SHP1_LOTJA|nr:unknown [Lotus japonicus]